LRLPRGGWIAVVGVAALAAFLVVRLAGGSDGRPAGGALPGPDRAASAAAPADDREAERGDAGGRYRRWIESRLERAVADAGRAAGGTVQAAAMLDGWTRPAVAASEPGAERRPMRMWSIAKVVTAVAVLRALGWGDRPGRRPSPQLEEAMHDALVRSENCRQRRMVLGLQQLRGGPDGARSALAEVLAEAGAGAELEVDVEAPESLCLEYLATQEGSIADPYAPTLLLGTATWRIADQAAFLHALGSGTYGEAIERRLLSTMREPKGASTEVPREEFSAALDWGAGRALAGLDPAYKAGWGGTLQGSFMAAQGAVVELGDGRTIAFAVAFHPDVQPPKDDPGLTEAPLAIERVLGRLGADLFVGRGASG